MRGGRIQTHYKRVIIDPPGPKLNAGLVALWLLGNPGNPIFLIFRGGGGSGPPVTPPLWIRQCRLLYQKESNIQHQPAVMVRRLISSYSVASFCRHVWKVTSPALSVLKFKWLTIPQHVYVKSLSSIIYALSGLWKANKYIL